MENNRAELIERRAQMTKVNEKIMQSLNEFFQISNRIGEIKDKILSDSSTISHVFDIHKLTLPTSNKRKLKIRRSQV